MLLNKTSLALANLASKEESRYTLQGIAIEKNLSAVTNGHYLVTVDHATERADADFPVTPGLEPKEIADNETVLLSRDAAIGASKALPKKTHMPILQYAALGADSTLYVNQLDSVQTFKSTMQGRFPNWRQVMPSKKPVAEVTLSAEYLELIAKFIRENGDARAAQVRLTLYGETNAVRFDAKSKDGQFITAVLMPMRSSTSDFAKRPDHVKTEAKAAAEANATAEAEVTAQAEALAEESTVAQAA